MIRDDATERQVEAANPTRSTWLSANAGSGKTRVLTDRVARLLLGGTRPENILCLTYTKAAASEMQNRLFQRLGEWAMLPEGKLRKALIELGDKTTVSPAEVRQARTLFAAAIETPGGLKIQTIHSFCSSILRRFPLEAGVSPQFKEMEDRAAQLLRDEVLSDLAMGPNAYAFEAFAQHYTGAEIDKMLAAIVGRKASFLRADPLGSLEKVLGLPANATEDKAVSIAFIGGETDLVQDFVELALGGSATYQKMAKALAALDLDHPTLDDLNALIPHFLYATDKTSKSANWPQSNHTKAVEAFAPITDDMHAWMDRTFEATQYLKALAARDKTRALHAFALPFIEAYETKKIQRAALDFDDLIGKAKSLLEDPVVAQWVLFRLDGGVDHVLVDEAQDTSPDQWDIVRLLTQEFSTGLGANPDRERTVFVVGDKKQSIYSFQGADPVGFDRMRAHFETELSKVNKPLQDKVLEHSFRSSLAVLELVDQTFQGAMADGVGDHIRHLAFKSDMPGRVDLWPVIEQGAAAEPRKWDDPLDIKRDEDKDVKLARQIAAEIKRMIREETLPHKEKDDEIWSRRAITPGDFLILVQRRSDLFAEVIRACKAAGLEIAGADRLKLGAELAVKDLSALLQFLALPEDDLSLAACLKSPLFGWSEQDLFSLAHPRPKGQTLWEALRKSNPNPQSLEILNDLRGQADFMRPYDLLNRILVRHGGRKSLLARLGHEAEDGIDALLAQALSFESTNVPSLTGFVSWMQTEEVEIKRQMDAASDRIRVMTVHGAKGLEAPIVILPDTAERDKRNQGDLLAAGDLTLWKPKSPEMPVALGPLLDDLHDASARERRRLLYVALTRAENWLIIAAAGKAEDPDKSWYAAVKGAMAHLDAVDHEAPFGTIKRFSRNPWDDGPLVDEKSNDNPPETHPSFGPTVPEPRDAIKVRAPSDLGGLKALSGETETDDNEAALAWGRVLHQLLEVLPELASEARLTIAEGLVSSHPDAGLIEDKASLIKEAMDVINAPHLADLFKDGMTEVPISATISALTGDRLFGIIDRLIVTEDRVLAVDFKSNSVTPDQLSDIPLGLLRQMAAYRDALREVFPNHNVETALLWTKTCSLDALPDKMLDDALVDVTTS